MKISQLKSLEKQLSDFVEQFAPVLGRSERRYWCKLYLTGLLLDGERKSIEPMAARVPGGDEQCLQQFVNQSAWHHDTIQRQLLRLLIKRLGQSKCVLALDDTSLPKKGEHSVGVARQYCGALGKVANCQSIVTWHFTHSKGDISHCWANSTYPKAGPRTATDEAGGCPTTTASFSQEVANRPSTP